MENLLDIVTIGECLVELSTCRTISEASSFDKYFGADALCTAVSASRCGSKVGFITKIGDDFFKDFLYESLKNENLDITCVSSCNNRNGVYFVGKSEDNLSNQVEFYRKNSSASCISFDDINEDYIKSTKIFYATGTSQALSQNCCEAVSNCLKIAKENSVLCAYDPNFDKNMWSRQEAKEALDDIADKLDILFLNITKDVEKLYEINSKNIVIKHFWDLGIGTVVLKSPEEQGVYLGYNGEIVFIDYYNKCSKDAFGAGDAFNGAFLHAFSKGFGHFEACRFACVVSGLQAQKQGAIKSIPFKEESYEKYKSGF